MNLRNLAAVLALGMALSAFASNNVRTQWRTDCVGRMQLQLPGPVDYASIGLKDFTKEIDGGAANTPHTFEDGQTAPWSDIRFPTPIYITHPLDQEARMALLDAAHRGQERARQFLAEKNESTGEATSLQPLPTGSHVGLAFHGGGAFRAFFVVGTSAFRWAGTATVPDYGYMFPYYQTVMMGLRSRAVFDVPHDPGVCLPYAFIRDDGTTRRRIGMTYRLKAHPDVTIWLEDANTAADGPHVRSETLTARYRAKFFWEQRYQNAKRVSSEWTPGYRLTTIDGREALETFVKLVRYEDNIEDYGYLAVVRGDPDAAEDSPDLMLYVIRDAANATKRGIAPIGRDELLEMARTIAASVRRRPVQ